MANKFEGTLEKLQMLISVAGLKGGWEDDGHGKHTFRSSDGGVLNWWESSGTVQLQGQDKARTKIGEAISESAIITSGEAAQSAMIAAPIPKQIFIVHGHDSEARDQLELALHRLGLKPFILMNTSGGGKTIIEALEGQIGRDFTSDFGIVLMTPDDFGYSKKDGDKKVEPRPRQNVVLEAGMLLASLTRSRMAIIVKGHLEMPSDLQGIIHLAYNDHVKEIIPKLCERLKEVGYDIAPHQIAAATQ
jgi:predicted nucleotide-binding protein